MDLFAFCVGAEQDHLPASRRKNTVCSLKLLTETRADGATARRLATVYFNLSVLRSESGN